MKSLNLLVLMSFFFSFNSIAKNPHHKLNIVVENYIKKTDAGKNVLNAIKVKLGQTPEVLFHCFNSEESADANCNKPYVLDLQNKRLFIHANFNSASFEYLSWIVSLGLFDAHYNLKYKLRALPKLVDIQQLIFINAQFFWGQLGADTTEEIDYYFHPRFSFAKKLDLSIVEFSGLSSYVNGFLRKVSDRSYTIDKIRTSADQVLRSRKYGFAAKAIAQFIVKEVRMLSRQLETSDFNN